MPKAGTHVYTRMQVSTQMAMASVSGEKQLPAPPAPSAAKLCLLCKTSTPCHCVDCLERREFNTHSVLAAIHTLHTGRVLTDGIVTDAVKTLADAAQSGEFDGAAGKLLGSPNCLQVLVAVLGAGLAQDKSASNAQAYAASTLAAVAFSGRDAQLACFAQGAIPALVGLLRGGDDSTGAASAARAICAICSGLPEAQEELMKHGGVLPLITMLSVRRALPAAQEAARALACLAPAHAGGAVKHWIRWCQGRGLAPLRAAIDEARISGHSDILKALQIHVDKMLRSDELEPEELWLWKTHQDGHGNTYYYNTRSGESRWNMPAPVRRTSRMNSAAPTPMAAGARKAFWGTNGGGGDTNTGTPQPQDGRLLMSADVMRADQQPLVDDHVAEDRGQPDQGRVLVAKEAGQNPDPVTVMDRVVQHDAVVARSHRSLVHVLCQLRAYW